MKITDYEKVQALAASNIFLLDKDHCGRCFSKGVNRSFKFQRFYRRSKSFRTHPDQRAGIR